jgi:tetratricopeptide (TPR) repeat protein
MPSTKHNPQLKGQRKIYFGKKRKGTAMRKFTLFIVVLMAALLAAGQSWAAEVGTAQYYLDQGKEHFKGGNLDQAITDYNKALELNPNLASAYNNLGAIFVQKDQFDRAMTAYNKAIELDPKQAQFYNNRGGAYRELNHYDEAIADFNRALELNPNYANAYYNRAVAFYQKKAFDRAWDDVKKTQSLGGNINPEFLEGLRKASGREK